MSNNKKATIIWSSTIAIISVILFSLMQINKNKKTYEHQSIAPPVKEADIPFDRYELNSDSAIKIHRTTGTNIHIKPNSFLNQDGTPVKGKVELKVREFHNANEVLRSGIPMRISGESNDQLESAGMIELRANADGKELIVNPQEKINIELAAYKPADGYQLYYLENNNEWKVKDTFITQPNNDKLQALKELEENALKNEKPDSIPSDRFFVLGGDLKENTYLQPFENLEWEILEMKNEKDLSLFKRINWDEVKIEKINKRKMKYHLSFSKTIQEGDKKYNYECSVIARPLMGAGNKRDNREAFADLMAVYEEKRLQYENEKLRVEQEAALVNSFTINKMGIWNCDRLLNREDIIYVSVSFDFENEKDFNAHSIKLYTVFTENNSVLPYKYEDWKKIGFSKTKKMMLIAIISGNRVAIASADDIQKQVSTNNGKFYFNTRKEDAVNFLKRNESMIASK